MGPRGFPARHIGNPKLRDARLRRGWTGDDVALALHRLAAELGEPEPGVDSTHVSKWERGTRNPGRFYKPRLCLVFEAMPQEIGLAPNPRLLHDIGVLGRKRVERELQRQARPERPTTVGVLHAPGPDLPEAAFPHMDHERLAATMSHIWPADQALVDGLARARGELSYRTDTEPPGTVLPDLRAYLDGLQLLLSRPQLAGVGARIRRLASTVAMHAGFLSDVAQRWPDAYAHFAIAESLAREAESGTQLAMVLINKAEVYRRRTQRPEELGPATALARAAELAVGPDAPAGLHAWIRGELAAHEAELGDEVAAGHHLERAYRVAAGAPADELNLFAPDLDSAWLEHYRGANALRLRRADEAIEVYAGVLRTTDPRLLWERAYALSQLASAWLLKEEVERACGLLEQAVDMTTATGDRRGLSLALRVRERQLRKWRNDPHVRRLDEALRAARRQG